MLNKKPKFYETYKPYQKTNYEIKIAQNEIFINFLKVFTLINNIFILDSVTANTSRLLFESLDTKKDQVYCPNYDENVAKKIEEAGFCTVHRMWSQEFILRNKDMKFTGIWMDTCSSWSGSKTKGYFIKKDIANIFKNKMLENKSIFAITVCMHGEKGHLKEYNQKIKNFILDHAESNGYKISSKEAFFYRTPKDGEKAIICKPNSSSMSFQLFEITDLK